MQHFSTATQKIVSLFLIAFAFFFPHYGGFPFFSYAVIVLIIVGLFLKYVSGENFKDLFFSFKDFRWRSIWLGAIAAVLLVLVLDYGILPLLHLLLPNEKINLHDFDFIKGNLLNYILVMIAALVIGGFYEELIFQDRK